MHTNSAAIYKYILYYFNVCNKKNNILNVWHQVIVLYKWLQATIALRVIVAWALIAYPSPSLPPCARRWLSPWPSFFRLLVSLGTVLTSFSLTVSRFLL